MNRWKNRCLDTRNRGGIALGQICRVLEVLNTEGVGVMKTPVLSSGTVSTAITWLPGATRLRNLAWHVVPAFERVCLGGATEVYDLNGLDFEF